MLPFAKIFILYYYYQSATWWLHHRQYSYIKGYYGLEYVEQIVIIIYNHTVGLLGVVETDIVCQIVGLTVDVFVN